MTAEAAGACQEEPKAAEEKRQQRRPECSQTEA